MSRNESLKYTAASILLAAMLCGIQATASEPLLQSKHQMMKECMAKQKASDSGRLKEDMKKSCRDLIKTGKQNAEQASASGQTPHN
jgi:hypothetical protein